MSDYVYDWELPADMANYRFDLDVDLDQSSGTIDPELLSLRPSDAGQSG